MTSREFPLSSQINIMGTSLKILSISATFPSSADPTRGVFVKERLRALASISGVQLRVVSPTPWFPPIKMFKKWYRWSQYPQREQVSGLTVDNPRYLLPPKIGGYFHPQLIDFAATKRVDQIHQEFPFDLIDAHWVYPAGAWAVKLGQRYGVPVFMTGRGEDMARFPNLPLVGNKIRWALKQATGCIGVSQEISQLMIDNGASVERVCTVANGIDTEKFQAKEKSACRQACSLPQDRPIVLSVGDRLELKGFHLVAQAIAEVKKNISNVLYVIVGGPGRHGRDYTQVIEAIIQKLDLQDNVLMVGPKPHSELIDWYNAADLYAMMSSREGSPNVLLESLACGTPVVGHAVGGIYDELADQRMGRLIMERSAPAAAAAILDELNNPKDRAQIALAMQDRTWRATANRVHQFFQDVVSKSGC